MLKGGEPDLNTTARSIIYDWQRGNIPYYNLPPGTTQDDIDRAYEDENEMVEEEVVEEENLIEEEDQ